MPTIRRTVQLYRQQAEFRRSAALYRAFVGGISTGKSWVGAYDLIRRARRGRTYMVIGPTYTSLNDSSLKSFMAVGRDLGVIDPQHLRLSAPPQMTLATGATVMFRSADRPDMLRGPNLSGVWLDEASLMPQLAYEIAIGRLRECGEQGWLSATFTPKGPSQWTHSVFAKGGPHTHLVRARTADNPFNPPGFAETLRGQYTESFARQELDGEFVQPEGAFFPAEWFDWPGFLVDAVPEGCPFSVLYLDPSLGKDAKKGDDQAFVRAAWWPGPRQENLIYLQCVANRDQSPDMVSRGVRLYRDWNPTLWGYEVNGTMGLLDAEVRRKLREANAPQRVVAVTNTDNKFLRIRNALDTYLAQRRVRVVDGPGGRKLVEQLSDLPEGVYDDCADAAAGAVTLLEKLVAA